MAIPTIQELEKIIEDIDYDIKAATGEEYFDVSVRSNGNAMVVEFIGIHIWDSDNDDREYTDEENDNREPIESFLRKRINEEIVKLSLIKL